jgi:hypothetical protein
VLERLQRAEHHAVVHPNYALAPLLLNDLRIKQRGQGHPARFGTGSLVLAALGLRLHARVAQDGREILLKPVAEPRGHPPWCQYADNLMSHTLGQRHGPWSYLVGQ